MNKYTSTKKEKPMTGTSLLIQTLKQPMWDLTIHELEILGITGQFKDYEILELTENLIIREIFTIKSHDS